ncbi:hypothetical protein LOK74_16770 [Brevibacillus humidisoli]|uniref:hypothetical protein n=1 Tax=Brevibacillus humidisoli TaxID=2895522 RepID=UPI001E39A0C5|nr:hypothetical protein [Brevibacillus humidisoli]UFJ39696.1 hypothetical protein LOK74_16770 [Brevibacillus humidisoli]
MLNIASATPQERAALIQTFGSLDVRYELFDQGQHTCLLSRFPRSLTAEEVEEVHLNYSADWPMDSVEKQEYLAVEKKFISSFSMVQQLNRKQPVYLYCEEFAAIGRERNYLLRCLDKEDHPLVLSLVWMRSNKRAAI